MLESIEWKEIIFMERVYNFSAGPSVMPLEVLERAQKELVDYNGMSVMEMSHRSAAFQEIFDEAKNKFRMAMNVPDTHEILFLQGGATLQFAAVPMNLIENGSADYAVTGNFSKRAAKEAEKYGKINVIYDGLSIPKQQQLKFSDDAKYFYYCANNTAYGTEWHYIPEAPCTLACDMSSDILTREVDISKYGLIFAGAQKNMAPAGLTVVIIDKALAGKEIPYTPQIMSYKTMIDHDSMINTPPCWCIYMLSLTLDWISKQGGIKAMDELKKIRSGLLYDYLDESKLFIPSADRESRSFMNVTFSTGNAELDKEFSQDAEKHGFVGLKGYKLVGGMRASIYNAMPVEGVEKLVSYMKEFEAKRV